MSAGQELVALIGLGGPVVGVLGLVAIAVVGIKSDRANGSDRLPVRHGRHRLTSHRQGY